MDDYQELEALLERATAPGTDLPAGLDAETAELRAGWLELSALLARAEAEDRGCDAPVIGPAQVNVSPVPSTNAWPRWLFAGALAASILGVLAVTVWWQSQLAPQPGPGAIAKEVPRPAATPNVVPTPMPEAIVEAEEEWLWDDGLDEEIVAAGQAVLNVEQDWFARSGASRMLSDRMDRIEQTWENDSL
jgi:hypothetical protein